MIENRKEEKQLNKVVEKQNNDTDVIVYTKGSGENEDGRYGWAYVLENMTSEKIEKTDSFRTEMHAVLNALIAVKKSASVKIYTNNESIAKICKGEYKADKSKELYKEYKELEDSFTKAGGKVDIEFIPKDKRNSHFDELRKMARN